MVFNWVWKNMMGGDEDENCNATRPTSEATTSEATMENASDERNGVAEGSDEGSQKISDISDQVKAASTTNVISKNGGSSILFPRSRKNKLPIAYTESTTAKKARYDGAMVSTSTPSSDQTSFTLKRITYEFDDMLSKLAAFKDERGHCRVPQNFKDDRKLAAWVKNIRRNQKPGKLVTEKQVEQLNAIGFQWESKAGRPVGATIEAGAKTPARKFRKPIEDDVD